MKKMMVGLLLISSLLWVFAQVTRTPSLEGADVYFINLKDGDSIKSPVLIQFGLTGMGIAPAGIQFENTGHHHILIDLDETTLDLNTPLPATDNIMHFGKGQTETLLELTPGTHTLQILLGDASHLPHNPVVTSEKISIAVIE